MPRPRTNQLYVKRVAELTADQRTVVDITRTLEEEAVRDGRNDAPSYRTVRRLRDRLPDTVRVEDRLFQWPQSMKDLNIPWESARDILDYVRWRIVDQTDQQPLPTARVAKWLARLCLAAPTLRKDLKAAEWYAEHLAAAELGDELKEPARWHLPGLTEKLALQGPWKDLVAIMQPAEQPKGDAQ